ncbi:right-handed parallel beta-helix repeat-containing protein [Priestia megaterium]|uniref:right-handed parallel beta-helix repeat-containing protein n=1 Tax=Priestia megaterium TaxID=1404 RepID=UPI003D995088
MKNKNMLLIILIFTLISISSLIIYKNSDTSKIYVESYREDSDIDDGESIQRAISWAEKNGGGLIILANKTYTVSFIKQELPSHVTLKGSGKKTKIVSTKPGDLFRAVGKKDITIKGISFKGIDNNALMLSAQSTDQITIKNCFFENLRVIKTDLPSGETYNSVTREKLNHNIQINNNIAVGLDKTLSKAAIELAYVEDAKVKRNRISKYKHGIQWWGGDANPAKNGALNNPRWAINIVISKNTIQDINSGGIWGSMGTNIKVSSGNVVSDCGDVGIDFEGSTSSEATGNYIKNCKNGCLTTFFENKEIKIRKNIIESDVKNQYLFKIYNSSHKQNHSIQIYKNKFRFIGSGIGYVGGEQVDKVSIFNNDFINTVVHLYSPNFKEVYIHKNKFLFTNLVDDPFNAVRVRSLIQQFEQDSLAEGEFKISNNIIKSEVTQPNKSRAIYVEMNEKNLPSRAIVEKNETEGFQIDVEYYLIDSGANRKMEFILRNNMLHGRNFVFLKGGSSEGKILIEGNYDGNGLVYLPRLRPH